MDKTDDQGKLNTGDPSLNAVPEEDRLMEQEYLRMLDTEVPDLWDRIRAGLDRQQTAGVSPEEEGAKAVQEIQTTQATQETEANKINQTNDILRFREYQKQNADAALSSGGKEGPAKKKKRYGLWIGGIAAAAAVILLSAFLFSRMGGRSDKSSNTLLPVDEVSLDTREQQAAEANYEFAEGASDSKRGNKEATVPESAAEPEKTGEEVSEASASSRTSEENDTDIQDSSMENTAKDSPNEEQGKAKDIYGLDSAELRYLSANRTAGTFRLKSIPELGLSLMVEDASGEKGTLVFTLDPGKQEQELKVGDIFSLRKKSGDSWIAVLPASTESKTDGTEDYLLTAGSVLSLDTDWGSAYGELPEGMYRILKKITVVCTDGGEEIYFIAADFTIP